jgi:glycerol-3-phosphate dehydrogenase (NAD(P)+)
VFTAPVAVDLARRHNVDMPITSAVAGILAGQISVDDAIERLVRRPLRSEQELRD